MLEHADARTLTQMFDLMEEAQELFETEFDPLPEPEIGAGGWGVGDGECCSSVDLDGPADAVRLPAAAGRRRLRFGCGRRRSIGSGNARPR